jgi:hypothetical protein
MKKKCLIYFKNKQTFNMENVEMSDLSSLDMLSAPMTPKSKTRGWVVIVLLLSVFALIALGVYVIFFKSSGAAGEAGETGATGSTGATGETGQTGSIGPAASGLVDLSQIEDLVNLVGVNNSGFDVNDIAYGHTGWYDSTSGVGELTMLVTADKSTDSGSIAFAINDNLAFKFVKVSFFQPIIAFSAASPQIPLFGYLSISGGSNKGVTIEGLPSTVAANTIIYKFTLAITSSN